MSVKLLTEQHLELISLKGGCTGSSESRLVKMPHCWKSHVTAQLLCTCFSCLSILVLKVLMKCAIIKVTQSSRKRLIRRIFTPTFGFVRILFLLGILIYGNFFLLTHLKLLKITRIQQRESKFCFHHKRSEYCR